ncbi:MAG: hypothetical protein GY807_04005 [Gammaproteobacteria bacterium]|nr:hypothetical protein [Gammaproteobacteria bacterium]
MEKNISHTPLCKGLFHRLITLIGGFILGLAAAVPFQVYAAGETSADYIAIPPFIAQTTDRPNVIISLDTSGSMKIPAYGQIGKSWSSDVHDNFDPSTVYYGYFDPTKYYVYDDDPAKLFFIEDPVSPSAKTTDNWDGNFLNWLSMRRFDIVRKVLIGGKVRDRNTESIGGDDWYVLLGQDEPQDRQFYKSYTSSSAHTPTQYADGTVFEMANGKIIPTTGGAGSNVQVINVQDTPSESVEMGQVTMDWQIGDPWVDVSFINTYATPPVVVAKSLAFNGGDPTLIRVQNITTTGFQIRMQEWDYKDGNHTTEELFYIAANSGNYNITLDSGSSLRVEAGTISGVSTLCDSSTQHQALSPFLSTPVLFTGISTFNEADAVVTRNENVATNGFDVCLQEQESKTVASESHAAEDIHYIAIAPGSAVGTLPSSGVTSTAGAQIEIGDSGGTNIDDSWDLITFATTFREPPTVVMDMQTLQGDNTATLRVADDTWTTTQMDVKVEEEKSDDSETTHVDERIGYVAVSGSGTFNIHLAIKETDTVNRPKEPKGLLQALEGGMRLGLAVFNYNHDRNPTSVYSTSGKDFDGGTFFPCYPDVLKPTSQRTNWDICKETYAGAPLDDLIEVIEDHPLIWATTPIAETLYNIGQYAVQGNHPTGTDLNSNPWPHDEIRQGYPTAPSPNHTPLFANNDGSTAHPNVGTHPPYKVNNTWDPYYYSDVNATLPCAKTFVLNFNDGAPYTDWDTSNGFTVPTDFVGDGDGDYGENEALDDVALMFRNQDIRDDLAGHQEIVSYYVLAALGADPSEVGATSRRRLMEAAVNGGFNDLDGDHLPDVAHPADIVNYISTHDDNGDLSDGGDCSALINEWDQDGDCVPDTFFFANDGFKLEQELLAAFQSILKRVASGAAASVLAGSTSGEGAIYQARFEQERTEGATTVHWIGDITATFIDSAGRLREDGDGDQVLDGDITVDEIIDMCYNTSDQEVRVKTSDDPADRPTSAQFTACNQSTFSQNLFTVDYLWSAGKWLYDLSNTEVLTQGAYSAINNRYIVTAIDGSDGSSRNGIIERDEQQDFEDASFSGREGLLSATTNSEAADIVNFTRGSNAVASYRSRQIEIGASEKTWRLGDVIHSSPIALAMPAEDYHFIYAGTTFGNSYKNFVVEYLNRRTMVFTGANDGMVHAFNGGYYDQSIKTYQNGFSSTTQYPLGKELWAYLPYNVLPHLKYLADATYGSQDGDHLYMIDAEPRIFDARIFNDAASSTTGGVDGQSGSAHPNGWGTILVGSMRFGGGPVQIDVDNDGSLDETLSSSFFILDITDPESPPQVLFEYTMADLGFTMSIPTPIRKNDVNGIDQWYLLLGSGPIDATSPPLGVRDATSSQHARLLLLDLKSMSLESAFDSDGIVVLNGADDATNAFVTGMLPVDYNLDTQTDAVYISTVSGTTGNFAGKLYRLTLRSSDGTGVPNSGSYKDIASWSTEIMLDDVGPISALPNAAVDSFGNRWIFIGTGRFLVRNDAIDSSQQAYYGIKEPRDSTAGGFIWGAVDKNKLVNVTTTGVNTDDTLSSSVDTLSSANSVSTYSALNTAMVKPPTSTFNANHGWYRSFGQSPQTAYERNVGQAAVLGGILAFTTFEPSGDICAYEGSSNLYALSFTTGTANPGAAAFGTPDTSGGAVPVVDLVDLGEGLVTTVSFHTSPGYKKTSHSNNGDPTGDDSTSSHGTDTLGAIAVSSTGENSQTEMQTSGAVTSGESNWRFEY